MDFTALLSTLIHLSIFSVIRVGQSQAAKGLHFKIDEESPTNSFIGSVDPSVCGGSGSTLTDKVANYRLVSDNAAFLSHVEINRSTGKMNLRRSIDRDSMCDKMKLCCQISVDPPFLTDCVVQIKAVVELVDLDGSPVITSYCNVNLEIADINDHSPTFSQVTFTIKVSEASPIDSFFQLPIANDADSSKFSVSRYYLKETSRHFRLELSQDGAELISSRLIVKSRLDREEMAEHIITLVAVDSGSPAKSGSLSLAIIILDENDNEPVIEPLTLMSMKEDVPIGHFITRIQAHDKDKGENAMLSYHIKEYSTRGQGYHFKINELTGDITTQQRIDYDSIHQSPQMELTVTVKDHGKPKTLSSSATLTIVIVDVNDEAPKISIIDLYSRQPAQPEIRENLIHNQFVAFVNVRDEDHGINGQVKCELLGDQSDFGLENIEHNSLKDQNEFKLVTKTRLDCERKAIYNLIVSCHDMGQPQQSNQEEVMVRVTDLNDNVPTFGSARIELQVAENQPHGSYVATLNVTDLDETDIRNGQFEYIMDEGGKRYFRMESIEARGKQENAKLKLYTIFTFDREKVSNVEFKLIVKDVNWGKERGPWQSLSSTSTIIVKIMDLNDNAPMFSKSQYEFTINEEKPRGQFVGLVQASDDDSDLNGKIQYKIEDLTNNFIIDSSSGVIQTRTRIDREKVSVIEFKVTASDHGRPVRSNLVNIIVRVNDVNDNDPKFIYPTTENHTVITSIHNSEGSLIMKVNAVDNDEPSKGQLTYSIDSGDDSNLFKIDQDQGGISFSRKPKSSDSKSHFLTIKVSDNDFPTRSAMITIHLKLDESTMTFLGHDYVRGSNQVHDQDQSWKDDQTSNKFPINRNVLLVICLIVITATLAGVLLMLILCIKRPQRNIIKSQFHQTYQDSSKTKIRAGNVTNVALNYLSTPADQYQGLIHDNNPSGYSGLAFFKKNTNINTLGKDSLGTCGNESYHWVSGSLQQRLPAAADTIYQKIATGNDLPTTTPGQAEIGDQISSIGGGQNQLQETMPRALNERYETLGPSGKSATLNSFAINNTEKNLLDHGVPLSPSLVSPKRSLIASSFV